MPELYLNPIENEDGSITDPAADIAAYLLSDQKGWKPDAENAERLTANDKDLKDLVLEHLKTKMYWRQAEAAIESGKIPDSHQGRHPVPKVQS